MMGIREFLRGGYHTISRPVQITKHGHVIGIFTPAELEEGERIEFDRTKPAYWYISNRRRR